VNGANNELIVYLGDYYAGRFAVQLGSDAPRDGGTFEVIEITAGREYFDRRSGYRIAKEDPANPYGSHWIGLRGEQVTAGHNVGIHVANDTDPGAGCFRVNRVDAEDLSAILSAGSRVTFVR
jgi:lipoprotein-anchoring transpeptidase ErfK/SrfK